MFDMLVSFPGTLAFRVENRSMNIVKLVLLRLLSEIDTGRFQNWYTDFGHTNLDRVPKFEHR